VFNYFSYDQLVREDDFHVLSESWMSIQVKELTPGDFYITPFYFWAPKDRPVTVKIFKAGSFLEVATSRSFNVGPRDDMAGVNKWTEKRYRLDEERQDGSAFMTIGWKEFDDVKGIPLTVLAGPLTSKKLRQEALIADGKCPQCKAEGHWQAMAMVCPEHGVFLG